MFSYSCQNIAVKCKRVHLNILSLLSFCLSFFFLFFYFFSKTMWKHLRTCVRLATRLSIYWIQTQYILLIGEQLLTIFICIKGVRLNWNFIANDVQSATYSSHGAPCPARDLFPRLNTRVKVHISLWTIREYPKRHFWYLSDMGDTFLQLTRLSRMLKQRVQSRKF